MVHLKIQAHFQEPSLYINLLPPCFSLLWLAIDCFSLKTEPQIVHLKTQRTCPVFFTFSVIVLWSFSFTVAPILRNHVLESFHCSCPCDAEMLAHVHRQTRPMHVVGKRSCCHVVRRYILQPPRIIRRFLWTLFIIKGIAEQALGSIFVGFRSAFVVRFHCCGVGVKTFRARFHFAATRVQDFLKLFTG